MNKTTIETCDYTWNPVTGCWGPGGTAEKPKRCAYCYANRIASRFLPPREIYRPGQGTFDDDFSPIFWPERLPEPAKVKTPSKIFVGSMADLFGDWVPSAWIEEILQNVRDCPQHIFQFLTKNPKRLKNFNEWWTENCWVGTTVTNQVDADERVPWLLQVDAPVLFVSHEPLLSAIDLSKWVRPDEIVPDNNPTGWGRNYCGISWAIIGAQTGPGAVKPEPEWVDSLIDQYRVAGVPCFVKDSLYKGNYILDSRKEEIMVGGNRNFNNLVPAETERLFCLIEEMGESLQIIGKIGRHGYKSRHPSGGPDNRELLEIELGHLLYSIQTMAGKYDIEWDKIEDWAMAKKESIKPYLHHQSG